MTSSFEMRLPSGHAALVDEADRELLMRHKWFALVEPNTTYVHGYPLGQSDLYRGNYMSMHRLLMDFPVGFEVDHRNGNGLDNRRSNLRLATNQQNRVNRRIYRSNTSGYKGVGWSHRNGWHAKIGTNGECHWLGSFDTPEAAALAYNNAALEAWGEFARLNEVPSGDWGGRRRARPANATKTHCPQGHEYNDENTYTYRGSRRCRICNRAAVARYAERERR